MMRGYECRSSTSTSMHSSSNWCKPAKLSTKVVEMSVDPKRVRRQEAMVGPSESGWRLMGDCVMCSRPSGAGFLRTAFETKSTITCRLMSQRLCTSAPSGRVTFSHKALASRDVHAARRIS